MKSLDDVLNFLGWTSESLDNIPDVQQCSISNGHLIPSNRVEHHMEKCRMRQQGYTKEQIDSFWSYSDDEIRKFSEAALQSSGVKLSTDLNFNLSNTQFYQERDRMILSDHEKAFVRDLKRRRQSYRGIHTAKKSYIEILREVIEHQTALLSGSASSNLNPSISLEHNRSDSKLWRSSDKHSRSSNPHSDSHSRLRHSYERQSRLPHRLSNDRSYYRSERSRSRERSNWRH